MSEVRVSPRWGALAVASLVALAVAAPEGLYLLGFLAVVIVTHELGHYTAARRSGMGPVELFWGFGPEVVAFERNGCRYGLKALFLGGYVKLHGMTPSSELPVGFPEARTYRAARHRARLATILAGPAVNLGSAVLAFAAAAVVEGAAPTAALGQGLSELWFVLEGTVVALWSWGANLGAYLASLADFSGRTEAPVRFMSPVAQAEVSGYAVERGLAVSLRWFGILSAAIGAVNLLPLPPLDGSHAVVAGADGLLHRLRPSRPAQLDVTHLLPLAWFTVIVLAFLSLSALVMDLRDVL